MMKRLVKMLSTKILTLKIPDAKILKFCFNFFPPTQFPSTWRTSNRQINTIRLPFVNYKTYFRGNHPYHKSSQLLIYTLVQFLRQHVLVQFLQQYIWHITTCHQFIKNIKYTYRISVKKSSTTIKWTVTANRHHANKNATSRNNLPKQAPHVPNDPDSDTS